MTAGLLAAASAASLATSMFVDALAPLILGIAFGAFAASMVFRLGKGAPRSERVLPALGFLAALAAFSMFRVAMKAFSADTFDVERILTSLRVLAFVPGVALLAGVLATFAFGSAWTRVTQALAVALVLGSGVLAVALDFEPVAWLRVGGRDVLLLAGLALAAVAGAHVAWRHRPLPAMTLG